MVSRASARVESPMLKLLLVRLSTLTIIFHNIVRHSNSLPKENASLMVDGSETIKMVLTQMESSECGDSLATTIL
jgi:hypothetical protein